jgi:hypothetical protein
MSGTKNEETYVQGANILGLGRNNLAKVSVDTNCRMDLRRLETELQVSLTINNYEITCWSILKANLVNPERRWKA